MGRRPSRQEREDALRERALSRQEQVDALLRQRPQRDFLSYYGWQVFVRKPGGGTRRITGPR